MISAFVLSGVFYSAYAVECNPLNPDSTVRPKVLEKFGDLPMSFESGPGQDHSQVKFLSRGPGYTVFLAPTEAVLSLRSRDSHLGRRDFRGGKGPAESRQPAGARQPTSAQAQLRMRLLGANPEPILEGSEQLPGTVNYFIGDQPQAWRTEIPTFAKVRCREIYPGVDLIYYGNHRQLEYDFVVSAGADPGSIALAFEGVDQLEVDAQGELALHVGEREVRWHKPYVYQAVGGARREIPGSFVLQGERQVGFQIGAYDSGKPLVIDPVMVYSTYLGGGDDDYAQSIAVDTAGNVYVAGSTASLNFPTTSAYDSTANGLSDVFVTKINAAGTALVYSTYLGGTNDDYCGGFVSGGGLAVDGSGNAYITGRTYSGNFPRTNQPPTLVYDGGYGDAFLAKLRPDGTKLLYSTYLGGNEMDSGNAVVADNSGNAYVVGETLYDIPSGQSSFPNRNDGNLPHVNRGNLDVFVAKFNTTISGDASWIYSGRIGDNEDERATGVAVDGSGNVYLTGEADSALVYPPTPPTSHFPVVNALQPLFNGGSTDPYAGGSDGFVVKLNNSSTPSILFSTFLGGYGDDYGFGIFVDASGNIYVTGKTTSTDFPVTANAVQPVISGGGAFFSFDAFATKLSGSGAAFLYSTYLGGTSDDYGYGIAADGLGNIYVTGETGSAVTSTNGESMFPVTVGADQTNMVGSGDDAFVAKISPAVPGAAGLVYSTFWGGSLNDGAYAIALDASGNSYICGFTSSTDFPTNASAYSRTNSGGFEDAFVAKFSSPPDLSVSMLLSSNLVLVGGNLTNTLYVNNNGRSTFTGVSLTNLLPAGVQFVSATNTRGNYVLNGNVLTFNFTDMTNNSSALAIIVVTATTPGSFTNTATLRAIEAELNTGNNTAAVAFTNWGIADVRMTMADSPSPVPATSNLTYTISIANKGPWPATSVVLNDPLPAILSYVSATNSQGSCTQYAGLVTCNLGTLASGAGATVTINVTAMTNGVATNIASATAFELDTSPANNTATNITTVNPLVDLAITSMTGLPNPVFASSNLTYTISLTNRGPFVAPTVTLTDPLPPGAVYVSAVASQGSCSQNAGVVTGNLGSLTNGGAATVTIVVKPGLDGAMTNTASVTAAATDYALANNTATVVTTVTPLADLAVFKVGAPNPVPVLSNLTYTITVTNRGPSVSTGVVLTDPLPPNIEFVSAQSSQGICTLSGGVLTCNVGSLANGTAVTVTVVVKPLLEGSLSNNASVTAAATDPAAGNNAASAAGTVVTNPGGPLLRYAKAGTNIVLYWSTNSAGFVLQSRTGMTPTNAWSNVTNAPVAAGKYFYVTNAISGTRQYYRLFKGSGGPGLSATLSGTNLLISWSADYPGLTLQSKTNLAMPGLWSPVTNVPSIIGHRCVVTNSCKDDERFYRLSG